MPSPRKGESKKDYVARFMGAAEPREDFPDEHQRYAVAMSMYSKKNSINAYGQEHPYPKVYQCNYIEPGIVAYAELGPCNVCGDKLSCGNDKDGNSLCKPVGENVLVKAEALARMGKTIVGRPVVITHLDTNAETVANGEADGIVTREWLDEKTGWRMCEFIVWDPRAQKGCDSGEFSVSCAYTPSEVLEEGGQYHNLEYHEEVINGEHTQLALVTNPRYEDARITRVNSKTPRMNQSALRVFANSKMAGGKKMAGRTWWDKMTGRKNALPLDLDEKINVDGKDVPMKELLDSLEPEKPKFNDDSVFETAHGEKSLADLKNAYRNKVKNSALAPAGEEEDPTKGAAAADTGHPMKENEEVPPEFKKEQKQPGENAADDVCPHCKGAGKSNADKPIVEPPLPDMRVQKNDAALDAAKKPLADKALDTSSDDPNGVTAELAAKNAADEAALDKEEEKNAADEALREKRNAGRAAFVALKNAREAGETVVDNIAPVGLDERLARGKAKYGKSA